ncbi:hypothetical protein EJ110_NYTH27816 [Nymphaea thermarum]|nr:hypothetical protein EJ110_NYTH27816 [Nymphaea thermarum]
MAGSMVPFILLVIAVIAQCSSAEHGGNQKAAMVVGTVLCDTCFHQQLSGNSRFISGATVAIECGDEKQSFNFRKEVQTDRHGKFRVELPFSVSHQTTRIRSCSVSLVKSNEPYCSVASMATTSSLGLKSRKAGRHVFSAGFFTFKPLQQPDLCYQKPTITSTSKYDVPRLPFVPQPNPPSAAGNPAFPLPPLLNLPYLPPLLNLTLPPLISIAPPQPQSSRPSTKFQGQESKLVNSNRFSSPPAIP